ncbi:hypothetical protein HDC30_002389 [Pseudomonas sp. JAI115]|uniref:AvrE-family type 3 secretion system effector n=1 Tax=Pseudomonas sp. JAI115 TaxID=2723061 RepID=UPI00161B5851|nr:AvrE-family type 3 secretion system effector [Pseudomonas sp. JAI115]MBB6155166.1 hypothetical protein [Pseudomonas sp. JAI115]
MSKPIAQFISFVPSYALPEVAHAGLRQCSYPPTQGSVRSLQVQGQMAGACVGQLTQGGPNGVSHESTALNDASSAPFVRRQGTRDQTRRPPFWKLQPQVQLDGKGRPLFDAFKSSPLGELLHQALGQSGQTYQASQCADLSQFLLDEKGYVVHLKQSPEAVYVARSSQAQAEAASPNQRARLDYRQGCVQVVDRAVSSAPLPVLPLAHQGYVTGIYQDQGGQRLCLHQEQLYAFDDRQNLWVLRQDTADLQFKALQTQGDGKVYGQVGGALVDLSGESGLRVALPEGARAYSVNAEQQLVVLSGEPDQVLHLADLGQADPVLRPVTLKLSHQGASTLAQSIGLSQQQLFVCDTEGRLYQAPLEALAGAELTLQSASSGSTATSARPRAEQSVVGFLSTEDGQVQALVSDRGRVHSQQLDPQGVLAGAGWNLSEALVLKNRRGLPGAQVSTPALTLDLNRLGQLGLEGQRITWWDAVTQTWKDSGVKGVEQLQCDMAGRAYVLHEGAVKKLNVSHQAPSLVFGASHALSQPARSTSVEIKDAVAALQGCKVTAFAMLSDQQFVVLDDQQQVIAHHPDGEPVTLKYPLWAGNLCALAFDEHRHLYVMTDKNELFMMARQDWQARGSEAGALSRWTSIQTPPGTQLTGIRNAGDNRLSATFSQAGGPQIMRLKQGEWQPVTTSVASLNPFDALSQRVQTAEKVVRLPTLGLSMRTSTNLMGRSNVDNTHAASTREFVRANIFKPSWEVPRVLKNVGHYVQHQYQGRKGLRPLYESESKVFARLPELSQQPLAAAGRDLKSRIAALNLGPQGQSLQQALETFRAQLEESSHSALKQLGQQHGRSKLLQQKAGLLNIHGELSAPSRRREVSMKVSQLSQKLNLNSSGHDLLGALKNSLQYLAPTAENHTHQLLGTLQEKGMQLSYQKAQVPLAQRRDGGESQGLVKADLALGSVTLMELGGLLDELECLPMADDGLHLKALQDKFEAQRAAYESNEVRQVTRMGFTDHASLEATYDGIKAFLNGFKKADHAISVNLRAATGSSNQTELAQTLKSTLRALNTDDEIVLQRSYGLNLGSPVVGLPSGSAGGVRTYGMNAERTDKGLTVSLMRDGGVSGAVTVGLATIDLWPELFGEEHVLNTIPLADRALTPALRLGVNATASASATQRHAVAFTVPEDGIEAFVDDLFGGELNPLQVMSKGVEHATQRSTRLNTDLNVNATAELRGEVNLSEKGSTPLAAAMRIGVGGTVNVNLLNYTRNALEQRNELEQTQEISRNRPRLLNSLEASASVQGQLSASHRTGQNALGTNIGLGASVAGVLDNKTSKRIKFTFKQAVVQTEKHLSELTVKLAAAFKDPAPQQELARLADRQQPIYKELTPEQVVDAHLAGLKSYFLNREQNDRQYAAVRALQRSLHQHEAAKKHYSVLDSARFESAYTQLSRLNTASAVSRLMGLVSAHHAPSNAEKVAAWLEQDATLQAVIKQLQASSGIQAKVRLELKDAVQEEIMRRTERGELSEQALATLLSDRQNMRIKTITVTQSASKAEGFSSPVPVVRYTSNASLNLNKVVGKIDFSYGRDHDTPLSYTLDGGLLNPSEAFGHLVGSLKDSGFELER